MSVGIYMLRSMKTMKADVGIIVPLVFVLSGWTIVIFAMEFNPYAVVAALLFIVSLCIRDSESFGEMFYIFAATAGLAFAIGVLSEETDNGTKLTMVTAATVFMAAYWLFDAPVWTAIVAWTIFAIVVATPVKKSE